MAKKLPWPRAYYVFDGCAYRWSGWFGGQLESMEWKTLPAGTTRTLNFGIGTSPIPMTVFSTRREGWKVRTTWSVSHAGTHDELSARIHDLRRRLQEII